MNKLNNKTKFMVVWIILFCIVFLIYVFFSNNNKWWNFLFNKKKEFTEILWIKKVQNKKFVWEYISDEVVDNKNIFAKDEDIPQFDAKDEEQLNKIRPYIRILCWVFSKTYDILKSPSIQMIKKDIDKISLNSDDKDYFIYITIPSVVYWECDWKEWTFLEWLIRYLQSDFESIYLIDKENVENFIKFINELNFNDKDIDKNKLKKDKEYFHNVFFENNRFNIEKVYFNEYTFMKDKSDEEYFKYFSILSIEELNEIQEKTLKEFTKFLKSLWIDNIEEFRKLILSNYWYWNNIDDMKKYLINKYNQFEVKLKDKEIDLTQELLDNNSLYNFYIWEKFDIIKNDEELYDLLKEIWFWYLHYSIISPKYAETLNQWWSWKEQFWDSIIWNNIIKLWFLILRESIKK